MGKKERAASPGPSNITNRETLQRLNFLYQASTYLANTASANSPLPQRGRSTKEIRTNASLKALSRRYNRDMREIASSTVTKTDPTVKRSICEKCDSLMIPGRSARVIIKRSITHGHKARSTCEHCGFVRAIPAPPLETDLVFTAPPALHPASTDSDAKDAVVPEAPSLVVPSLSESSPKRRRKKHRKRPVQPRKMPFFARPDAGHVVFRGSRRIDVEVS